MLEAKHSGSARTNPSQTLLAFMPRQVLLAEHKKKATTMKKHCSSKTLTLNPEQKALLLYSVLGYLELNGFSRTLKRLLSEAQIEHDSWKTSSVILEDMYGNYLETCIRADTNFDTYKEQELLTEGITKKDRESHCSAFEQTVGKKKKKKSDESDSNAAVIQSGTANKFAESAENSRETLANDLLTDSNVELKEKKKSKKVSDSVPQTEQISAQSLKEPTADTVCELQTDKSTKKQREKKKKKSQSISESLHGDAEQVQLHSLPAVNEEKCKNLKPSAGNGKIDSEVEGKSKDKKKQQQQSRNSLVENIEQCNSTFENMQDIPLEEKKVESKDKKRKKEGSVFETFSGGVAELANKDDPLKSVLKKECFQTSEDASDKEKKSYKKRKRWASDENEGRTDEKLGSEELKRRKTERLEQTKSCEQLTEERDNEHAGKESKVGNGHVGQNEFLNTSITQLEAHSNGNLEKSVQRSDAQKTTRSKQHNDSAEPKTVNAFQRVKVDEVEFVDERLQDNSYWAKDGADVGYGAKAQEILGQVRGRDFRHEKTKKKRGSYRGGQIDLQSHSVKFNYSDED